MDLFSSCNKVKEGERKMKTYLKYDGKTRRWFLRVGKNTKYFNNIECALCIISEIKAFN